MPYMEVAQGSVARRNTFIVPEDLPRFMAKAADKFELYRSVFWFGEELMAHLEGFTTVRGYKGTLIMPPTLILDIDRKADTLDHTRKKMLDAYESMLRLFDESEVIVHFSGRGFHIEVPSCEFGFPDSENLADIVKATVAKHFPWADPAIYIPTGLIRVDGTINTKTMLYKTRLTPEEVASCTGEQIEAKAATHVLHTWPPYTRATSTPSLQHLLTTPSLKVGEGRKKTSNEEGSRIVTCMQKLWMEGGTEGSRHTRLPALASAWRYAGLPISAVKQLGYNWAPTLAPREVDRIIESTWGKTYSCEHPVMKEYCDERCIFFKRKDMVVPVMSSTTLEQQYVNFIRTDFSGSSFNLRNVFTGFDSHRVLPGEMVVVWGDTGVGKSTFVHNLAVRLSPMAVLWGSFENHATLHYRRGIQIANGMTEGEVDSHYLQHVNSLSSSVAHIDTLFAAPQVSQLPKIVALHNPRVFVVDTLDGLHDPTTSDENVRIGRIAIALKELATSLNIIVVVVHHISKGQTVDFKGNRRRLTLHSGKGSSSVEQKADQVWAIEESSKPLVRTVTCLKARDQNKFERYFLYDPSTCRFTPTTAPDSETHSPASIATPRMPRPVTVGRILRLKTVSSPADIRTAIARG